MTASPAAPGTAPGGGAQDAATPVEALAAGFELRATICSQQATTTDAPAYYEGGHDSYAAAATFVRRELAPAWDALTAENERLRELIAEILTHDVVNDYMDPDKVDEYRARAGLDDGQP